MEDMRFRLLEQKVEVMQKEVSQVLQEMQTTIQAIAQTYSVALKVIMERLDAAENNLKLQKADADKLNVNNRGEKDETTSIEL